MMYRHCGRIAPFILLCVLTKTQHCFSVLASLRYDDGWFRKGESLSFNKYTSFGEPRSMAMSCRNGRQACSSMIIVHIELLESGLSFVPCLLLD